MSQTVAAHAHSTITDPANGSSLSSATVRTTLNSFRVTYNDHDADTGVHFQSSVAGSRPAAGTAGRKWLDSDTLRVYFDTGSVWSEVAYLVANTSGQRAADLVFSAGADAARAIVMSTSDGSDSKLLQLSGGGAILNSRGAYVELSGNEATGDLNLTAGTTSGASIKFFTGSGAATAKARVLQNGDVAVGTGSAVATDAVAGFLYIPTCAGTPTGTPTGFSGGVPIVFDTTNNKLYVYDGGWISTAALS